jgi:diguanylate cyclase (GGDEF)-like protein
VLDAERSRSQRSGSPFCIVLFDIDYFKRINDTHGHATGDSGAAAVLHAVVRRLRTADSFARYGGEEFILLLPAAIDIEGGHVVAERIRRHVAAYDWGRVVPGMAGHGVGRRRLLRRDEPLEQLIARADHALYEAKAAGRDRIVAAA